MDLGKFQLCREQPLSCQFSVTTMERGTSDKICYDADTFILEVCGRPSIVRFISSVFLSFYPHSKRKCVYLYVCVRVLACVCVDSKRELNSNFLTQYIADETVFVHRLFFRMCESVCVCSHTIILAYAEWSSGHESRIICRQCVCVCVYVHASVCACVGMCVVLVMCQ